MKYKVGDIVHLYEGHDIAGPIIEDRGFNIFLFDQSRYVVRTEQGYDLPCHASEISHCEECKKRILYKNVFQLVKK